jgi:hypothetical protein
VWRKGFVLSFELFHFLRQSQQGSPDASVEGTGGRNELFLVDAYWLIARFPETFGQWLLGQFRPEELIDLVRQRILSHRTADFRRP